MTAANAAAAPRRPGKGRRGAEDWPWLLLAAVVIATVFMPVGGLVYFASRGSGDLWPHLIANVLPVAMRTTVILLAGVFVVVTVVGVGAAWLVTMYRFPLRRVLEWALLLPLAVPTYIVAYAYMDVMHPVGPIQTWLRAVLGYASPQEFRLPDIRSMWGAILLLGFVLYPYVYLPVRALFLMQSASLLEVAGTLGAARWRCFWRVALPLARPAIAIGVTLALLEALNDIGASEFLGVRTLTVAVYTTWVARSSVEGAAQIALAMLVIVVCLVMLEERARRRQRYAATGRTGARPIPARLTGWKAFAAVLVCFLPILIGFVVPASHLVQAAIRSVTVFGIPAEFPRWVGNTVGFSAAGTFVAIVLGLALAYAGRLVRGHGGAVLIRLASIGYAIPGTVLAVGLLVPFATFDNMVDGWARAYLGISTGLLLSGSGAALVIAYVIRFLAISAGGMQAGLAKVGPSIDMAARSLGARPARVAMVIHMPLIAPAIAAAALLVFVDCVKELPATLLLRPFNFETLATFVYGEAARGTYEQGAVAALAIVVAGLLPVALLARLNLGGERRSAGPRRSPAVPPILP